jgi:hypothetical protein
MKYKSYNIKSYCYYFCVAFFVVPVKTGDKPRFRETSNKLKRKNLGTKETGNRLRFTNYEKIKLNIHFYILYGIY